MTRKEPSHSVDVLADCTSKGSMSFQSHSKRIDRYSNARRGLYEKTISFLRKIYKGEIQYTEEDQHARCWPTPTPYGILFTVVMVPELLHGRRGSSVEGAYLSDPFDVSLLCYPSRRKGNGRLRQTL